MSAWLAEIEAKASELVFEFGTSPQYWTQLLYKNGQRRVQTKSKVNAFNVFKVMKACKNEGKDTLMDLTEKYLAEYRGLSKEKKAKYIADFVQLHEENARPLTVRPTAKAQAQDLVHALANLKAIFKGLKKRLGIDGFFLIVNSHMDTQAGPFWWFLQEEIKTYMPTTIRGGWNMAEIGLKVQSYCIAGYDAANLCHNNKGKIGVLKIQCHDLVMKSLGTDTSCCIQPSFWLMYRVFQPR
ncbi:hypothetical protein L218DRAFT_945639 [Marasmius fiardii PR-910]|nr:hypothetical protein L218DRAFT_945639 [Marasmius fiardii PR-910]